MSRSQITCRACNRPLAERRHSGRIVVYAENGIGRVLSQDEEIACPECGTIRSLTINDREDQAA